MNVIRIEYSITETSEDVEDENKGNKSNRAIFSIPLWKSSLLQRENEV